MSRLGSQEQSIEDKEFWAASKTPCELSYLLAEADRLVVPRQKLVFSPCALTMIEELLINVLDQEVRASVSSLYVNTCSEPGRQFVEVLNFGPGFSVRRHPTLGEWEPYRLSMYLYNGSQIDPDPNSVTGGVNGVGLKIARRYSHISVLSTLDPSNCLYFTHAVKHRGAEWIRNISDETLANAKIYSRDNLPFETIFEQVYDLGVAAATMPPPLETAIGKLEIRRDKPFTCIRLYPRFDKFQMSTPMITCMFNVLESRLHELSTALNAPIFLNGRALPHGDQKARFEGFVRRIHGPETTVLFATLDPELMGDVRKKSLSDRQAIFATPAKRRFPLHVAIALGPSRRGNWACINGVVVSDAKTLFETLGNQILESLNVEKVPRDVIFSGMTFYVCGFVARPTWGSQTKNGAPLIIPDHVKFLAPYKLPDSVLKAAAKHVIDTITALQRAEIVKNVKDILANNRARPILRDWNDCSCYKAKHWSGPGGRGSAVLFIDEGESAHKFVTQGAASSESPLQLGRELAAYPFQGVPKNVRDCAVRDGDVLLPDEELARNVIWADVVNIIGLDFYKRYDTDIEFQSLNFGRIVIATDQDVDGEGKITSLILNFFDTFFPALIRRGFVYRFVTDLVRVFRGRKFIVSFRSEAAFRDWAFENHYYGLVNKDIYALARTPIMQERHAEAARTRLGGAGSAAAVDREISLIIERLACSTSGLEVKYYKGLGGHSLDFNKLMFKPQAFWSSLMRFDYDDGAPALFRAWFESSSEPRKELLRGAIETRGDLALRPTRTCTEHLNGPYREFCYNDWQRKLAGVYDGLNDVNRRILYTAMVYFRGALKNATVKTMILGAQVVTIAHYHHGAESTIDPICNAAKRYFGSNRFPFFIGDGIFGNRHDPKPSQPRYTEVGLNHAAVDSLFPAADLPLLEYLVEDGVRAGPVSFCPIIPPIFEARSLPSHGFQHTVQAIEAHTLIACTRAYIAAGDDPAARSELRNFKLRFDTNGWRGTLLNITDEARGSVMLSFGDCRLNVATGDVEVFELPFGMTGTMYIEQLRASGIEVYYEGRERRERVVEHPFIDGFDGKISKHSSGDPMSPNEIRILFRVKLTRLDALFASTYKGAKFVTPQGAVDRKYGFLHGIGLCVALNHQLNYTSGGIERLRLHELKSYHDVIGIWYPVREKLYRARIEREITLSVLERAMLGEIQRAFEANVGGRIRDMTPAQQNALLESLGLFRFAHGILARPDGFSTESLPALVTGFYTLAEFEAAYAAARPGGQPSGLDEDDTRIGYNYILNQQLRAGAHAAKRQAQIEALTARIDELRVPGYWARLWLSELDRLEGVCRQYLPTLWKDLTAVVMA